MPLRCLLFSPDEETVRTIGQVLTELEIEGETCFKAVEAVEKVTARPFNIVIIDWSSQPEAGFLLNTARERRPADRPLTLAIVSDDASVPTALQAGANSVLRKPLLVNQVKDTLATARDLLRSKLEAPVHAAAAAAAANSAASAMLPMEVQSTLHAGEFLQPSGSVPGTQFDIESSDVQRSMDEAAAAEIDPLKDLEPTAATVSQSKPAPQARTQTAPASAPNQVPDDEPRGLAWYLKTRAKSLPAEEQENAPVPEAPPDKAQLLGYGQTPSYSAPATEDNATAQADAAESAEPQSDAEHHDPQQREEAALFAYITGEKTESEKEPSAPRPWLKKAGIAAAVIVAGTVVYFTVPQAVMQKNVRVAVGSVTHAGHSWLNPQPATPPQAPPSHESFGRAGDEYKLPVAENIPDANTDPSQIRVLPMIDPTAKQPNGAAADPAQAAGATPGSGNPAQTDPNQPTPGQVAAGQTPDGQIQPNPVQQNQVQANQVQANQVQQNPAPQNQGSTNPAQTAVSQPQPATATPDQPQAATAQVATNALADPFRTNASAATTTATPIPTPAVQTTQSMPVAQPVRSVSVPVPASHNVSNPSLTGIPSSLKSQMAAMSPEASGNKPPEAALPSIEPVNLPEAAARGLLVEQPAAVYPPSARGQAGTVTLQVLIGRDGTVQDAKFIQGSLAFARTAIDAVKQWRFKPYLMNGRPASTQTLLTLSFKPTS
ncbi:MAG TPA: TonB family protein [Candidatus Sulfotelmatobacter sp.]|nr:TonB family protein [Candidatus Sulfotelmatobacter sp.]